MDLSDENEASITRLRANLTLGCRACSRILSGYKFEVLTLGCYEGECVTVVTVSSLPTLPSDLRISVCGEEVRIQLGGAPIARSEPLLIVHGTCNIELQGESFEIPCVKGELPSYLALLNLQEELQEFGLEVKGRILYKGKVSVYLVALPTEGILKSSGRALDLALGAYLLAVPGKGRLLIEEDELLLP